MTAKRFRVAFSFAGEKRPYVGEVAGLLAQRFGEAAILYDKYHQAEFSRSDLAFYLPDLYEKEADLVVAVFCPDYEKKEWCGLEWNAIFGLIKMRRVNEVMLTRFQRAEGKGLRGLAGYTDLDDMLPKQAVKIIISRLKSNGIDTSRKSIAKHLTTSTSITAIPKNLPRLSSFFGRTVELKKIADALSPKTRTWGALIDGPGGVGKTSLAIRAAELTPAGQFLHILFLSSKERKMTAEGERKLTDFVTPGYLDMLNEIARFLKKPELSKQPETDRARFLIEALEPARALLILDNLESLHKDDQNRLFEFLSQLPVGCKAIATSRRRTDVDARILRLGRLDQDAALSLIADLATDRPLLMKASVEQRVHLYEETGGNPLLLRWIAGQLGKGRCRTIIDALEFLRRAPADNDPLEFIFGDLLETFTDNETNVLAALTYFSQQLAINLIAALANISNTAAESALADLSNRALVVPDEEEKNFALVPMVADFLRRRRPEVVAETGSRLQEHTYAIIVENGYEEFKRFPVLEAAWATVEPALTLFVAGPNDRLQIICAGLDSFLDHTGRWDERISLNQQAEVKALAARDFQSAGSRAHSSGWTHYLRQEAKAVIRCADRAQRHWQKAQLGADERASVLRLRGMGYELMKDYPSAIAAYREALKLWRTLAAESDEVGLALNDVANIEQECGKFAQAERDYLEALRVAVRVKSVGGAAVYTGNLALLALHRRDWRRAEKLGRKALRLAEKVNRQDLIADHCRTVARALLNQRKPAKALLYARRSVEISAQLHLPTLGAAREILEQCN